MVPAVCFSHRLESIQRRQPASPGLLEAVPVVPTALEDLQREFPDWIVTTDRDFTGLCFAYRPSGAPRSAATTLPSCATESTAG
jgi:hypothetical protein